MLRRARLTSGGREREGAHGPHLRLVGRSGGQQSCVRFLQQLFDVGSVAGVAIETGSQDALKLQRLHQIAFFVFCHFPDVLSSMWCAPAITHLTRRGCNEKYTLQRGV